MGPEQCALHRISPNGQVGEPAENFLPLEKALFVSLPSNSQGEQEEFLRGTDEVSLQRPRTTAGSSRLLTSFSAASSRGRPPAVAANKHRGDQDAVDFVCAFENPVNPRIPVEPFDGDSEMNP